MTKDQDAEDMKRAHEMIDRLQAVYVAAKELVEQPIFLRGKMASLADIMLWNDRAPDLIKTLAEAVKEVP